MSRYGSAVFGVPPRADPILVTCDYVVVGGGTTGCVVAGRLSEQADLSVVLLEEGPRDPLHPHPRRLLQDRAGVFAETARMGADRGAAARGQANHGAGVRTWRRQFGQCDDLHSRNPQDYAQWEALGAEGWGYSDVLPYFCGPRTTIGFARGACAWWSPGVS